MKQLFGDKENDLQQWVVEVTCVASLSLSEHEGVRINIALCKVSWKLVSLLFSRCEMIQQHYWIFKLVHII